MNPADDPEVRAAVLASITPAEARWLAQHSTVTLKYCVDEVMQTITAASTSDVLQDWREASGIEPPQTRAPWRLG